MQAFSPLQQDVAIGSGMEAGRWELKLLPLDQIQAVKGARVPPPQLRQAVPKTRTVIRALQLLRITPTPFQRTELNATGVVPSTDAGLSGASTIPANEIFGDQSPADLNQRAADGFLINGTANNSASSPFALNQAFGNNRRGLRSLYNGGVGFIIDNSALDARPYSLTGQDTPKPAYNHMQGAFSFGGPLRIPHLVRNGPNFFVGYQFARNRNVQTQSGLVPTLAERNGDLSQAPGQIFDPVNDQPFAGNQIPVTIESARRRNLC